MFSLCGDLITIYASDLWYEIVTIESESMFAGCARLVGGEGTTYDVDIPVKNGSYACIDKGSEKPGYFTYKEPKNWRSLPFNESCKGALSLQSEGNSLC